MKKILIMILAFLLIGCSAETSDQLTVAVSIVPQETFVKKVAGDLIDVTVMIPPGNSPANYQPTPKMMAKFNEADLYFYIDVAAEVGILESVGKDVKLIDLAEVVDQYYPARYFEEDDHDHDADDHDEDDHDHDADDHDEDDLDEDDHDDHDHEEDDHDADDHDEDDHDADDHDADDHDEDDHDEDDHDTEDHDADDHDEDDHEGHNHVGRDPHIWLSPKRVIIMVETIRDELIILDPNNKETYMSNAQAFINELKSLDEELSIAFDNLSSKAFIMYHPSLGYFADDYGLEMIAIESEGKDATIKELGNVIEIAKANDIKFVFYQEEFDSQQAEIVAKEIDGETIKVAPLSGDYINNLRSILSKMNEVLD